MRVFFDSCEKYMPWKLGLLLDNTIDVFFSGLLGHFWPVETINKVEFFASNFIPTLTFR